MERLIIDTDPGEDDALAIMMAHAHPDVIIEAITTVAGNVGLGHTTNNAAVILDLLGLNVPIYPGCREAFVIPGIDAAYAHGRDGLGDSGMRSTRAIESQHAALRLIELVNDHPGDLTLVTLGPLTNIATALKLDPQLPRKLKRTVAMAGAVTGNGNLNSVCEFNVLADPEAAQATFLGWGMVGSQIEVVDWECTMRHGFSKALRAEWAALATNKSDFFATISAHSNRFIETVRKRTVQFFADPVAMAVALEPTIVTQSERQTVHVELSNGLSRGQTIVDWLHERDEPANAEIIIDIDHERLVEMTFAAQR